MVMGAILVGVGTILEMVQFFRDERLHNGMPYAGVILIGIGMALLLLDTLFGIVG